MAVRVARHSRAGPCGAPGLESSERDRDGPRGVVAKSRPAVPRHDQTRPRPRLPDQRRPPDERPRHRYHRRHRRPLGPQRLLVSHGVGLRDGRVRDRPRVAQSRAPHRLRPVPLEVTPRVGGSAVAASRPAASVKHVSRTATGIQSRLDRVPWLARALVSRRGLLGLAIGAVGGAVLGRGLRPAPPIEAGSDVGVIYHQWSKPGLLDAFGSVSNWGQPVELYKSLPGRPEGRPSGGRARLRAGSWAGDRSRHRDAPLDTGLCADGP